MKRLILAGGGHAHLHVLKSLAANPWPGVEVTLVSPYARQIYSGMVPGWMAGHYSLDQCAAALEPLAKAARVRFVQDSIIGIDATRRVIHTTNSGSLAYDALSLDTGAQVDSSSLAGSSAKLLPIRPLESFVVDWAFLIDELKQQGKASIAVVGGGAAGVELALAARYRLALEMGSANVQVTLVAGSGLLPGQPPSLVARVARSLSRHRIDVVGGYAVGCPSGLQLNDGAIIPADFIIAATGVKPAAWLAESGLALARDGFIAIKDGQQSISHPDVFAAGDVASRIDAPHAKSGVYAVRAGPVLTTNLNRLLMGHSSLIPIRNRTDTLSTAPCRATALSAACFRVSILLRIGISYTPQKRSLYLLATGPKEAIMSWGGFSASGRWAWAWKDWIDRRFMRQYDLNPATSLEKNHELA